MKQAIFFSLPPLSRNLAASLVGWQNDQRRLTGIYPKWYEYFRTNVGRAAAEIEAEQLETAEAWLREVCSKAPYYDSLLGPFSKGRAPRLRSWRDLARLPYLPKDKVRAAPEAFLIKDAGRRGLVWHLTSGSTGSPMRVPWYPETEQFQWAFVWARARPGVTRRDRCVSFTGQAVCDPRSNKPPFWVDNWSSSQRLCSIYHLSNENLRHYVDAIEQFRPEFMTGYSNAVAFLASGLATLGKPLAVPVRAFFASSEQLLPSNRRIIEQELNCRVWDHYGQVELVCAITEYRCGRLHVDLDYSHVELEPVEVDREGNVTAELVATNLNNRTWPLLRYRTGDLVVYHPDDRCPCGHPGQVIKEIAGRLNRFITMKDGRRLFNLTTTLRLVSGIRTAQARIIADGEIELNFVRDRDALGDVGREIARVFQERFGNNLIVRPCEVEEVARTARGKFMTIVD